MKEKIYTIPISEAFAEKSICPFCTIEKRLDKRYTEEAVGAGMMEPDIRIMTNKKGFCRVHYHAMRDENKALPLALVIQSHLSENCLSLFDVQDTKKKSLFGKPHTDYKASAQEVLQRLSMHNGSCYICEKLNNTLTDYAETTAYMYKTESSFRQIFGSVDSFCLKHTELLLRAGLKELGEKDFAEFFSVISGTEQKHLSALHESVTEFADSFDYRNNKPLSDSARDAVTNAIDTL